MSEERLDVELAPGGRSGACQRAVPSTPGSARDYLGHYVETLSSPGSRSSALGRTIRASIWSSSPFQRGQVIEVPRPPATIVCG